MIPIGDENRIDRAPVASRTIIIACCGIFLWQASMYPWGELISRALGFTPAYFLAGGAGNPSLDLVPYATTLVTYAFLHGSWLHLLGNMLFLWIFGDDVEDVLGHAAFIVFYLAAGAAAALAHALPEPYSTMPIIGASGAISGLLGAYLVLFPRSQVKVIVPIFIVVDVVRLPAWIVLAFWFVVQLAYELAGPEIGGRIAFRAHIGGFIFGMIAAPVLARLVGNRRVAGRSAGLLR
jgi:membrane associated rhomboid family serine protease